MMQQGTYHANIVEAILTKSQSSGLPQVTVKISVTHMGVDGDWKEIGPVERTMYWSMSEKAADYAWKKLDSIQFAGDFQNMRFGLEHFDVTCEHNEWEGQTRERWDLANFGGRDLVPTDQKTMLDMNAKFKAFKSQGSAPPPPAKPTSQSDREPFDPNKAAGGPIPF